MSLFKMVKHDLTHSARAFFALGAIGIAFAAVLSFSVRGLGLVNFHFIILSNIAFWCLGVACVISIYRFYRSSLFGKAGYLSLTLPVRRGVLLAAKLLVSMAWFVYVLVIVAVIVLIISQPTAAETFALLTNRLFLVGLLDVSAIALFVITLLLACTVLANCVFASKRIGIIGGLAGLAWGGLFFLLRGMSVYASLLTIGLALAMSAPAILTAHYLLNRRVSLR